MNNTFIEDDGTFGAEMTQEGGTRQAVERAPDFDDGTFGATYGSTEDRDEGIAEFFDSGTAPEEDGGDLSEFGVVPEPAAQVQSDTSDPLALLDEEARSLLEWARSPIGSRMQREAANLVAQYGGEDALLQALDTPQVDEAEIQAKVREALAPVLSAVDEYGEPKYDASDPLVQHLARQTADNIRAQTIQSLTARRQAEQTAQSRTEAQIASLQTRYPNAEINALRAAAAAGGNLEAAAKASHAHYSNLLVQTKAAAINKGLQKPATRMAQGAPAALVPGGRAPQSQGGLVIPDPIKEPQKYERFRQAVMSGKIKL